MVNKGDAPGRAQATLEFPGREVREVRLDLVATPAGWRVADVHTRETPSLAGLLDEEQAKRGGESESYPTPNEPTKEPAKMLRSRTSYLREEMIPIAK